MKSSDLISNRVPFTATFPGGKVQGFFNPQVSSRFYYESRSVIQALADGLLVECDLEGDDGKPIPITQAALENEPDWIVAGIWEAILETRRPNPTNSAS